MSTRRFEYKDEKSNKFWEIRLEGDSHTVRYGRIGSDGQTKTKEFDSAGEAEADAEKLIKSKLKKGYQEVDGAEDSGNAGSGRVDIAAIASADDPTQAVRDALRPVLTQGPACEKIFNRLFENVQSVDVEEGRMTVTVVNDEDEECAIEFEPPFTGEAADDVPPSYLELVRNFNGIGYEGYLPMGMNGLRNDASISSACGGWECEALEEGDNDEFLAKLKDAGFDVSDVPGPIDFFQNWIILNPAEKNELGEPAVYFVSHGDCEAVPVKEAANLKWGPLMLRVLAQAILREDADYLEAVYD